MKKLMTPLLLFFGFFLLATPVYGATQTVVDEAELFTAEEIESFNELAQTINEKIKGEVFIVTTDTNQIKPETHADNLLRDRIGNDNNGSLLLLDMRQREIFITTSGNMIDYLNDRRIESLLDDVYDGMSTQNYGQAARSYLVGVSNYIDEGVPKGHYRIDRDTGKITYYKVLTMVEIAIALIIAAAISLGIFFFIKSRYQMTSGTFKYDSTRNTSFNVLRREDRLVNSFVRTRRIPRNTSSGGGGGGRSGGGGSTTRSSGGGTFGGGGRKF
jgi:uncharacterized protein